MPTAARAPTPLMASLGRPLAAYDLGSGDVIYVDTGTYLLANNIVITAQDSGATHRGARFGRGPFEPREPRRLWVRVAERG